MATTAKSLQAIPAVSNGLIQTGQLTNGHATEGDPIVGQSPSQGLIAICGMALRLPAGIRTPQQLWEFLLAGGDARGRIPISRYNVAAFHDETGKHGTLITEYGYFLEDDIGALDTSFLCMPRMEVERIDPQQRLMLEVARECLEDAGEPAWGGKRIGCYIGSLGEDWCEMFARETQHWGPYRYTGFGNFALSKRISYEMDLQGPSMTTRTACSASLVAFHEACVAISRHDCDSAVVGGVNLIMTPGATMSMTEQNVLSRDGSCKTFSADADGYARGEAVTAIYIAVALSWDEVEKHLVGNVAIACDNSPKSVTISGDVDEVKTVIERIHRLQPDVSARKLQIDRAYHSYHMPEIGEQYYALLEGIVKARKPKKLFFSSVTGCLWDDNAILDSHYWQRNLERPVMFRGAVSSILQHPVGKHPVFLDIGPHSALGGPLRQIPAQESSRAPYASALSRNQNCVESLLSATGMLWTLQIPIALDELMPTGLCLSDLPPYPWDHEESYWYETRLSKDYRLRKYPHHDLLGVKVVECTDFEPSWRNHFHLNTAPWVRDHRVGEDIVFPFAAYVAMAGEAIRQIAGIDQTFRLRHIIVSTALVIAEGKPTEMITTLRPHRLTDTLNSKWWEFIIASHNGHTWTKHCTGEVMAQAEPLGRSSNPETLPRRVDASKWFDVLQRAGLDLGPEFGKIGVMSAGTIRQQATGEMLNERQDKTSKGCFRQVKNRLPISCDDFSISRSSLNFTVDAAAQLTADSVVGEARGITAGNIVLSISGLKLRATDQSYSTETSSIQHAAARQEWGPDVDFLDLKGLVKPLGDLSLYTHLLDKLSHLCIVYIRKWLAGSNTEGPHFRNFRRWVEMQFDSLNLSRFGDIDDDTVLERIHDLVHGLADTTATAAAIALQQICSNLNAVFSDPTAKKNQHRVESCVIQG